MLVLKLFLQALAFILVTGAKLQWQTLLRLYTKWEGFYNHEGKDYKCSLAVHSADYVGFTSDLINIDMKASSDDNETVTFNETLVWQLSTHTELKFVGNFLDEGHTFCYVGNMSSQESNNFGTVNLTPSVSLGRSNDNTRLRYGLAIGIPLVLAILLIISSVFILQWGIKKGYLRHVPRAYKYFTNPRRGKTDFEMNDPEGPVKGEQTEAYI